MQPPRTLAVTETATPLPRFPRPAALALRPLPLAPLSLALSALTRRLVQRHPGLLQRLGEHGEKRFLLDPTDLPLCLLLDLSDGRPRVRACRTAPEHDARIAGPLSAFLGMVHGAYDGDALFFSRDVVISGDTGAALALRNAIDDAELDLAAELADLAGPLAAPLRGFVALAERQTGLVLHRVDLTEGGWA